MFSNLKTQRGIIIVKERWNQSLIDRYCNNQVINLKFEPEQGTNNFESSGLVNTLLTLIQDYIFRIHSTFRSVFSSMNVPTISWEMSSYIILLFLLWVIIRYFANTLMETLQTYLPLGDGSENGISKVDPWLNGVYYPVSYWIERGGRQYQEDRFQISKGIVEEDSSLYAVYDGHAGFKAAQYCKEHLFDRLLNDPDFSKHPAGSLKRTFHK